MSVIAVSGSVAVDVANDVTGSSAAGAGDDEVGGSGAAVMPGISQPGKTSREKINRAVICNLIVFIMAIIELVKILPVI